MTKPETPEVEEGSTVIVGPTVACRWPKCDCPGIKHRPDTEIIPCKAPGLRADQAAVPSPSSEVTAVVKEWDRVMAEFRAGDCTEVRLIEQAICMRAALTEQAKELSDTKAARNNLLTKLWATQHRAEAAEAALETARGALRKIAILEVHRPAHGGNTVRVGWRCEVCDCDAEMPVIGGTCCSPDDIPHALDCPLAALPSPTPAQKGETK